MKPCPAVVEAVDQGHAMNNQEDRPDARGGPPEEPPTEPQPEAKETKRLVRSARTGCWAASRPGSASTSTSTP